MKILAIGDPHGDLSKLKRIPKKGIDLILLTGDLGSANLARKKAFENIERKKKGLSEKEYTKEEDRKAYREPYDTTIKIMNYLRKIAPVYTIYGNVEPDSSKDRKRYKKLGVPFLTDALKRMKNVRIINNRLANFQKIRIGGLKYFVDTNWVRDFRPSDFRDRMRKAKKESDKAKRILNFFGNVDLLVCHQPPYGFLDKVTFKNAPKHWKGKNAGSKVILDYIRKEQPRYVFCGHIHEGEGRAKIRQTKVYNLGVGGYKIIDTKSLKR
jgi:Icc-related predicted phosphoesterase